MPDENEPETIPANQPETAPQEDPEQVPEPIPEPIQTIPDEELENGYYWATKRHFDDEPRQPVWVGFINGTARVWCTGRRNSTRVQEWNIISKLEHP